MDKAVRAGCTSFTSQSTFGHCDWPPHVCVWGLGATCHGWCQSCCAWKGMEMHQLTGLPKSWYVPTDYIPYLLLTGCLNYGMYHSLGCLNFSRCW